MRYKLALLLATVLLAGSLVGCTQIKLSGGGKTQPGQSQQGGSTGGTAPQDGPPPLTGEWELTYIVNGQEVLANVMFAQEGNTVTGQGTEQNGDVWQVQSGSRDGSKINFVKKTVERNGQPADGTPVTYTGEMQYSQDPSYTGWICMGTYSFQKGDGSTANGDWLAVPHGQEQAPPGEPEQPPPQQQPSALQAAAPPAPRAPIGSVKPKDISGRYHVTYSFNFKKINCKMWLKHDGEPLTKPNLSGDGVDTTTGEKFQITKGWYAYPNVTIHRQYTRGQGAKESRLIIFKGKLSSDGQSINMRGETQFGGQWEATLTR